MEENLEGRGKARKGRWTGRIWKRADRFNL